VSNKVLAMALAQLLLGDDANRPIWVEAGTVMIAVDTLVHTFLHRTGMLRDYGAEHPYGSRCYAPGGCADIVEQIAGNIDARRFNPSYPANFPRFVRNAIWRFCAEAGLNRWMNGPTVIASGLVGFADPSWHIVVQPTIATRAPGCRRIATQRRVRRSFLPIRRFRACYGEGRVWGKTARPMRATGMTGSAETGRPVLHLPPHGPATGSTCCDGCFAHARCECRITFHSGKSPEVSVKSSRAA
jgi:hypothetical protein